MKVQTKITLLLMLVVATFLAGLAAFRAFDRIKFRRIAEERYAERNNSFAAFLAKHGEKLETLALYDSASDDLVSAIASGDRLWFEANVARPRIESFGANAAWIYRPDGTLAYQVNDLSAENLAVLPIPPEAFATLFGHSQFAHFFVSVQQGVMEIQGAGVHPSKDFKRQLPPAGYLFVGRLWSKPALDDISLFTGNMVRLVPADRAGENLNDEYGLVAFSRTLYTWDGKPLAQLVVRNQSSTIRELRRSSEHLLLSLILFALVLFLLLMISLVRWVRQPLRRIMASLTRGDPEPIKDLMQDHSEFGELARTVQKFFEQRDNLIREMDERRATEEALRKREEELLHSQKMEAVGRLAGGIAHDFNNLLTAIIGYAELINARQSNETVVRQHADLIRKAGEQAATLTRQLLAFSRKQLLQPRVIDLNHLVVEMEQLLRRVIGERFQLETLADAQLGTVMADPSQIEQVILNLGVNARDAMPSGGRLTIRTANVHLSELRAPSISVSLAAGDYVELSVTDTGIGMDEETKSRIFEPFFTTKGPGKGTGLGLATVYGIVRQSGGGISVNTSAGKGSTFRIYLPLERSPVTYTPVLPPPVEKSRNFETVLVVEDEEIVRELVCAVLAEQGYNVLCAADGLQAMKLSNEYDGFIHVLITDVIMPRVNGPELATKLTEKRPDMKVLYVSGYSDNDIGDHGVLDIGVDLLQKPFTPQSLARKVRDVIQEGRYAQRSAV